MIGTNSYPSSPRLKIEIAKKPGKTRTDRSKINKLNNKQAKRHVFGSTYTMLNSPRENKNENQYSNSSYLTKTEQPQLDLSVTKKAILPS